MTTWVSAETWHKSRYCQLFGHRLDGYMEGTPYARLEQGPTDNLGTVHMDLVKKCDRCGQRVIICKFHLPKRWKEAVLLPNSPLVLTREGK
jgi:hypothetical protein